MIGKLHLYSWGTRSWYLLNKELVRPQSWSRHFGEERNPVTIKPWILHYPAHSQDVVPVTLPYLCDRACRQFDMSGCVQIYDCGNLSSCKVFWFPGQDKKFKLRQNVWSEWCIVLDILYTVGECYYRHSFENLSIESLSTCTAFWIMVKCTCVGINRLWLLHERPESFIFAYDYL